MSVSTGLYLRKGIIHAWKNHAGLTALVPTAIYPPQAPPKPVRPFVKLEGTMLEEEFVASCMDGNDTDFTASAYTQGDDGENLAWQIAAEMVAALADPIDLEPRGAPMPAIANVTWRQTQVIQDQTDASKFRALVNFQAFIVA